MQRTASTKLPIGSIVEREKNVRSPSPEHVLDIAESISHVGLVQPPAVTARGVLLAGLHRLLAVRLILAEDRDAWWRESFGSKPTSAISARLSALSDAQVKDIAISGLPVLLHSIDESDEMTAIQLEVAENERRRDHTEEDVQRLIERLRAAGYVEPSGRPRRGQKLLKDELAKILGKSRRTAERLLAKHGRPRLSSSGIRKTLVLSVPPELDAEIRSLAEKEQRDISDLCREFLRAGLDSRTA